MFSKKGTTTVFTKPLRPGLVGKRFIMMREEDIHVKDSQKYRWKQGCIRACSAKDIYDPELQVLIEYDGISWEYRQWIKIYEQTKAFYVESNIVWAPRILPGNDPQNIKWWPALAFVSLIDFITADVECKIPIEYFGDKLLVFLHEKKIGLFKEDEECSRKVSGLYPNVQDDIKQWKMLQKTQSCLMKGAETLTGVRVIVYRLELRQWYTGCITAHNLSTGELHVMDDNVLQTHPVDPALVQIKLMASEEELNRLLVGEQSKSRRHRHLPSHLLSNSNEQKSQGKCVSVKKSQFEENGIDKKNNKKSKASKLFQ